MLANDDTASRNREIPFNFCELNCSHIGKRYDTAKDHKCHVREHPCTSADSGYSSRWFNLTAQALTILSRWT